LLIIKSTAGIHKNCGQVKICRDDWLYTTKRISAKSLIKPNKPHQSAKKEKYAFEGDSTPSNAGDFKSI
jgi:hypothetical protein